MPLSLYGSPMLFVATSGGADGEEENGCSSLALL